MDSRFCYLCQTEKPLTDFYPIKTGKRAGEHEYRCKDCMKAKSHKYMANKKADGTYHLFNRHHGLKAAFGITLAEYDALFARQGNKCAACGTTENGVAGRAMPVDHDHETGKIRGILCTPCNQAAGHAYDSPDRLEAVAAYLRRHELRETALRLGLIVAA